MDCQCIQSSSGRHECTITPVIRYSAQFNFLTQMLAFSFHINFPPYRSKGRGIHGWIKSLSELR
jgi:hypothetical protein